MQESVLNTVPESLRISDSAKTLLSPLDNSNSNLYKSNSTVIKPSNVQNEFELQTQVVP
jgi:hypothetical protein